MDNVLSGGYASIKELKESLEKIEDKNEYLQHCCPRGHGGSGGIAEQSTEHFNAFFSHSSNPKVAQDGAFFMAPEMRLTSKRHIEQGEELTVDYDKAVGYEAQGDHECIAEFLKLCEEHGVQKRPSRLTLPPVQVRMR